MKQLKISTDGGARGNPGPAASGFLVFEGSEVIHKDSKFLGVKTNNFAEYFAVLLALNWIKKNLNELKEVDTFNFFLDSELVVKQLNGVYKIKSQDLIKLVLKVRTFEKIIRKKITYQYVPRSKNKEADKLVNITLDRSSSSQS